MHFKKKFPIYFLSRKCKFSNLFATVSESLLAHSEGMLGFVLVIETDLQSVKLYVSQTSSHKSKTSPPLFLEHHLCIYHSREIGPYEKASGWQGSADHGLYIILKSTKSIQVLINSPRSSQSISKSNFNLHTFLTPLVLQPNLVIP